MWTLFVASLACIAALHPGSFSRSKLAIDGPRVSHTLRVQVLSLTEVLPIDLDGDMRLDQEELATAREQIAGYITDHYALYANDSERVLSMDVHLIDAFQEGTRALPSNAWLQIERVGTWETALEALLVSESLFVETAPAHIEYVSVAWAGQAPSEYVLHDALTSQRFTSSGKQRSGPFVAFLGLGVQHILTGYDHLLFLLALLVGVRNLRSLAWVVSAFTLAHSLTLAAAALGLFSLPSQFVELAIALSIVYVAMGNLLGLERRALWLEALIFGLLHGLGFAGFLGDALADQEALLVPLVGFNLGVECGQLLAVVPPALLFAALARRCPDPATPLQRQTLMPTSLGKRLSLFVALCGFYWFLERAGLWSFTGLRA